MAAPGRRGIAAAMATLLAVAALAGFQPVALGVAGGEPSAGVTPSTAAPGEAVTLTGSGWPAATSLVARMYEAGNFGGPSAPLGMAFSVDASGGFAARGSVPVTLFGPGSRANLTVVPGSYIIVVSSGPGSSVSVPFTVGAPARGALLWGEVAFDLNGNGRRDPTDLPSGWTVAVAVSSPTRDAQPLRPMADARGRYQLHPIEPGSYVVTARAQFQSADWSGSATVEAREGQVARADLLLRPDPPTVDSGRHFPQSGFSVDNDAFWDYFIHRGGIRTLGYPISRTFQFQGHPTQFFQRVVLQEMPGGEVQRLNLLDPDLLPYTRINGSQFPSVMEEVKTATPRADAPDYDTRIIEFVRQYAPDELNGEKVGFFDAFTGTVTCQDAFPEGPCRPELLPLLNLEIWGAPTSRPTRDPSNARFIYLRFQRGILHYQGLDAHGNPITEGILLGDWFKSLITGRNLPPDLEAQAQAVNSPYLRQYNPNAPNWVDRPEQLPATNLAFAFEP